jgi:hypothetical protein
VVSAVAACGSIIFHVLESRGGRLVVAGAGGTLFPTQAAVLLAGDSSRGGRDAAFTWLWMHETRGTLLVPFSPSDCIKEFFKL